MFTVPSALLGGRFSVYSADNLKLIFAMIKINESNVTIMVKDMDKSISFYERIGLQLQNRWDNHYAMLTTTGITIGLHPAGEDEQAAPTHAISIGFMVDQAEEAKALLDKNDIQYHYEDGKSGKYLHFSDPDGSTLYFTQPAWTR